MRAFLEILRSGGDEILLHPLRSFVTVTALLAPLIPFLMANSISAGIEREASVSLQAGGDFFITGLAFGKPAPLPGAAASRIRTLNGVAEVVPRIVAPFSLGSGAEEAVILGLPAGRMLGAPEWINGRFPRPGRIGELVMGPDLAHALGLKVGNLLPPLYHSRTGDRLLRVVGIFNSRAPIWTARLVLTDLGTAGRIYDAPGMVTDLQVFCREGARDLVIAAVEGMEHGNGGAGFSITTRDQIRARLAQSTLHRSGMVDLILLLAFIVGIGLVLVAAGSGAEVRAREVGLLKAIGWATDEVLLRFLAESLLLCSMAVALAIVVTLLWLRFLNGWGIAPLLIAGLGPQTYVRIPYLLTPETAGIAAGVSLAILLTGTIYPAWRAAIVPPYAAIRR